MVETRRRKQGKAPAKEAEEPAVKRQRGGGDEEKVRSAVSAVGKRESERATSNGASFSDAARAAWDAFFRAHFFFRPPSEFYALYELARAVDRENPLGTRLAALR